MIPFVCHLEKPKLQQHKEISGCLGLGVGGLIAKGHKENLGVKKIFYRMLVMVVTGL